MSTNGHHLTLEQLAAKNGYPDPAGNDHTCHQCGAPMECEYKKVIETRRLAQSIAMTAQNLERKLIGMPHPKRKRHEFSDEEAKRLLDELGSFRAVAKKLGVHWQTVKRAVMK